MFLTRSYDDSFEHRYDSDASFYQDNRTYYERQLRLEEARARDAGRSREGRSALSPASIGVLRRTLSWLRSQ
jgi:hypothetical protein